MEYCIVLDEFDEIIVVLIEMIDYFYVDFVLMIGGMELVICDIILEVMCWVIECEVLGMVEVMRYSVMSKNCFVMLFWGVCGICGCMLIVNLLGILKGVYEYLVVIMD